jgi:aryl-alcohol dehydrogenase-like predicted oxidoreductase
MKTRKLGTNNPLEVSAIGLGAWGGCKRKKGEGEIKKGASYTPDRRPSHIN